VGRRATRLESAIRATLEPLESRVLLSSITIQVQTKDDDNGMVTPSFNSSADIYEADTLRDAVGYAEHEIEISSATAATITFLPTLTGTITEGTSEKPSRRDAA
jgi:hypothetical protein